MAAIRRRSDWLIAMGRSDERSMTTGAPRFSVVVPAFNAEATIGATVASVLSQTRSDLEVIVVDDGSRDGTATRVERLGDPRIRLLSQSNKGLPAARNAGIEVARGRYVAFLDSDDLWLPRYLELADQAFAATDRPGFAYTDAHFFNPDTGKVRVLATIEERLGVPSPVAGHQFLLQLLGGNRLWVSTVIPAGVLDELGGFNIALQAAEDYEMWLRICVAGFDVARIPGKQGLYRVHGGQMSNDEMRMRRGELEALRSVRIEDLPTAMHRELLVSRIRGVNREIRLLDGRGPTTVTAARQLRRILGRLRQQAGLGDRWTKNLPADLAAVFPDLTLV